MRGPYRLAQTGLLPTHRYGRRSKKTGPDQEDDERTAPGRAGAGGKGEADAMSDESGRQQRDVPPQYSPDGRWWWDGHQWVPVQQAPVQRQYPSPPPFIDAPDAPPRGMPQVLPPPAPGLPSQSVAAEVSATEPLTGRSQRRGDVPPPAIPGVSATAGWALGLGIASVLAAILDVATFLLPYNPGFAVFALTSPLLIVSGIVAIVLGIRSQRQIARSNGRLRGREMAVVGWICGVCGLAIPVVIVLLGSLGPAS